MRFLPNTSVYHALAHMYFDRLFWFKKNLKRINDMRFNLSETHYGEKYMQLLARDKFHGPKNGLPDRWTSTLRPCM